MSTTNAPDLAERFATFQETHLYSKLRVGSLSWEYIVCGQGSAAVMLLPGAMSDADVGFQLITGMEREYRVLAPSYPAADSMFAMTAGVRAILDHEAVERAHLHGGSFGGAVAQCAVRAMPERFRSLVLSHTFAPDSVRVGRLRKSLLIGRMLPECLLRSLYKRSTGDLLPESFSERSFWNALVGSTLQSLPKKNVLATVRCLLDFVANYKFGPDDFRDWSDRILILESDNDSRVSEAEREALKSLYPAAQVHTFHATGHALAILEPDHYVRVVSRFLTEVPTDRTN